MILKSIFPLFISSHSNGSYIDGSFESSSMATVYCIVVTMLVRSSNHGLQIPLGNIIENTRNTATSINIQISYLPLLIAIILLSAILICFGLYVIEGRITDCLPTISETATTSPNSDVFSIMASTSSLFLAVLFTLYISAADVWNVMSKNTIYACRILTVIIPICFIMLSCCTLEDHFLVHSISAFLFFGGFIIFFILSLSQMKKALVKYIFWIRVILIFLTGLSFIAIACSTTIFHETWATTINTLGEYTFMLFVGIYILTWAKELSLVRLQVVLTDDIGSN
ncbi:hypothetical protein TRFO_11612 [Tritrichomonas foetus]|uniref:CWH43-like N-terminal domain-containing protein n=1 Tax=Tritrichomonas foetus TaxID=1144522 RepID=A0A1J4J7I9_9EUKA|nr:hypothetical protein TRFO_11612 [Tritrichomonas foetus]|eukprot:OHS93627.1 hypothetical protein TRFO_11612 [Tritrichomonas foetus]